MGGNIIEKARDNHNNSSNKATQGSAHSWDLELKSSWLKWHQELVLRLFS